MRIATASQMRELDRITHENALRVFAACMKG